MFGDSGNINNVDDAKRIKADLEEAGATVRIEDNSLNFMYGDLTPLNAACNFWEESLSEKFCYDMCFLLLENGADPNAREFDGFDNEWCPLAIHGAVIWRYYTVCELLIAHGAELGVHLHCGNEYDGSELHHLLLTF